MKHLTLCLLVLILICPLWAQAQLSKGTWYVSGSAAGNVPVAQGLAGLSLSTQNGTDDNLVGLNISPTIGYFFSDRLLAGSRFTLNAYTGNDALLSSGVVVAPFLRYYINPKAANNHFYANTQLFVIATEDNRATGANLAVGMTHFLAPGLGWDISLALTEPDFQIRRNTQLGLLTSLNVYLNPELKTSRKTALSGIQRGSLMIGGTSASALTGIGVPRVGTSTLRSLNLNPNLLYFVGNRLGLGASMTVGLTGAYNFNASWLGISPQVRYYFNTDKHRVLFASAAYSYNRVYTKYEGRELKDNLSNASVALGLNSFFTPNLALELAPNVNYNLDSETLRVGLDFGIQFFLHPRSKE